MKGINPWKNISKYLKWKLFSNTCGSLPNFTDGGGDLSELRFIERVKFELNEMHKFKPSQALVFSLTEILFMSILSFFLIKTSSNNFA